MTIGTTCSTLSLGTTCSTLSSLTALLKVLSDIFLSADQQQVTLLVLLDMSAAFDTVDHAILLQRLESSFGVSGVGSVLAVVLPRWPYPAGPSTRFHVFGRACQVRRTAGKHPRTFAVPSLYNRYSLDRFRIWPQCTLLRRWRSTLHLVEGWCSEGPQSSWWRPASANWISGCHQNCLKLNSDKTQRIWLGSSQQLLKVNPDLILLGASAVHFQNSVVDLGVVLDSSLSMRDHVSRLCRTSYYQLRQLRVIRRNHSRLGPAPNWCMLS